MSAAVVLGIIIGCLCCVVGRSLDVLRQLKLAIAFIYVLIWKKTRPPVFGFDYYAADIAKRGVATLPEARFKENPRPLCSDINASDSLGFCGVKSDGSVLVVRITRRHDRMAEALVYLRLPSGEEYQLPNHPDTKIFNTNYCSFTAAGLSFEILEPLRKWRIIFNGYLRRGTLNDWNNNEDNSVLVRFSFLWQPIYNYIAFPDDFKSGFLAEMLGRRDWPKEFVSPEKLFSEECTEQHGQLHGKVFVEDEHERQLILRGLKERRHGILDWSASRQRISIQGTMKNGTGFHIFSERSNGRPNEFLYGYVLPPCNMYLHHIEKFNTSPKQLLNFKKCPEILSISFTAGKKAYLLEMICSEGGFSVREGNNWDTKLDIKSYNATVNGKPGNGIIKFSYPCAGFSPMPNRSSLPLLKEPDITSCQSFVVHFNDVECRSRSIVGGKGASLASMSSIPYKLENFTVPEGLCLTKHAFEYHLNRHSAVKTAILQMQDVAWQKTAGSLPDECERVMKLLLDTIIPTEVKNELNLKLMSNFGDCCESIQFAIRSSAIGEDGDEISAAGQNETFLGIKGFNKICSSIIKCWASQFSFRSVEYKRQNGQFLNAGMGVVIQKMVPAEVAGVLFTRDPLTGSMGYMVISSNFGLGESVVSATADPDIIILKRSWNDNVTIHKKEIGTKKLMISLSDDFGTLEQEVEKNKALECTLAEEMAIKLGNVAIFVEHCFGSACDIEWAICKNEIFLLQSRPVTTENVMTDFDILHEFDSPQRTDEERSSLANVGEVMPGSQSPLNSTTTIRAMEIHLQRMLTWKMKCHRFDPTVVNGFFRFCHGHCMLDHIQQKAWALEKSKSAMNKATEVGFYGRVLEDQDVLDIALERFTNPPLSSRLTQSLYSLWGMVFAARIVKNIKQKYQSFPVPTDGVSTLTEAYDKIGQAYLNSEESMEGHIAITFASNVWNLIILNLLSQGSSDYTTEQYTDFAMLIGAANGTESGDVPYGLQKISHQISKDINPEKFTGWSTEKAYQWLCESGTESSKKFNEFLKRHGHRGIKELEVKSISWGMKSTEVVKILQDMLASGSTLSQSTKVRSVDLLDSIVTPLTPFKRKLMTAALKGSCTAICYREQAKSFVIKFYDCMRLAFRRLAAMMVNEGFLPDPELLFFITFDEIGTLIKTRSARIIHRAKQRQRLHPVMDKMQFPELMVGFPKPLEDGDYENTQVVLDSIKGFPVSNGIVQGPAKVVPSFLEVNTIKPGDILITYSTDIGWSPYFPLLAGVVTEIGGLVSHGAVVAREFGLPCIVGAQNATRVFKSGDTVLLDATKGVLSKVA